MLVGWTRGCPDGGGAAPERDLGLLSPRMMFQALKWSLTSHLALPVEFHSPQPFAPRHVCSGDIWQWQSLLLDHSPQCQPLLDVGPGIQGECPSFIRRGPAWDTIIPNPKACGSWGPTPSRLGWMPVALLSAFRIRVTEWWHPVGHRAQLYQAVVMTAPRCLAALKEACPDKASQAPFGKS